MKAIKEISNTDAIRYGTLEDAKTRYRFSRNTIMKLASECGAIIRYGKVIRINFAKMDAYIDNVKGA